jgi:secondary thiamine-phosphate synthase enzyme
MSDSFNVLKVSSSKRVEVVDITAGVARLVSSAGVDSGVCYVYVPHTTAAVTINENADPDVKTDLIKGIEAIVPDNIGYDHAEGNSPAHIKTTLVGNSTTVFIEGGQMALGTWQGIYFCEFDGPRERKVYVKVLS